MVRPHSTAAPYSKRPADSTPSSSCIARIPISACAPVRRLEVPVRSRSRMEGHHYSHSSGRASPVKAYYVERNRLFVLAKNFPARMLLAAPFAALARYSWHAWYLLQGRGAPPASAPKVMPVRRCSGTFCAPTLHCWALCRASGGSGGKFSAPAPGLPNRLPAASAQPFHHCQKGRRAVKHPSGSDSLLVIIPAFDEEGTISAWFAPYCVTYRYAGAGD